MSLRKVYGGTPIGNESRCTTCVNARIIEGYAESERLVLCDAMYPPTRVPFNVRQCSMYEDKRLPAFEEMSKFAWEIRTKSAGARAGFVTTADADSQDKPKELSADESEEVPAAAKTR
ncbi:MAG TPA: hypothetical protein VJW20_20535 [Candidatus Angelobacter sp.]|nr:hypothetical protein [Candidatus Angelobacter sp.]